MPVIDRALTLAINETAAPALEDAAKAYADQLRENITRGPRSGAPILNPKSPAFGENRSSPSEYPQEEHGDLLRSVDAWKVAERHYRVGFRRAPIQAFTLEGLTPQGNDKATDSGVRFPLTRTMESQEAEQRASAAIRRR